MSFIPKIDMSNIITQFTKADAIKPIIILEATVVTGRTLQAYKRGGEDEARERLIEESTGSIVWLCGVKVLNDLGDKILDKLFQSKGKSFDVGTDKVLRKPFDNFMKKVAPKKFTPTQVALLKGTKVLSSIILADTFIGMVVPKINQSITAKLRKKKQVTTADNFEKQNNTNKSGETTFKGALSGLNSFTNIIENTNTGKLLSTDAGIASGRMYNARSKEERREIAIRDLGSVYFYMWAQGHVRALLNKAETGNSSRLNPTSAESLTKYLTDILDKNNGKMTVEEFKQQLLGKPVDKLPEDLKITFESGELSGFDKFINTFRKKKKEPLQVAKISDLEKTITDSNLLERIKGMSKLQPLRDGEAVVTKGQILDAMNEAKINNPEFLKKMFEEFTDGNSSNEFKYVSNSKLEALKQDMINYVERLCKNAKDGNIDKSYLEKFKKRNLNITGINFVAGFAVAAAFLSTFIPKIQYYVTKMKTGVDAFPGTYDYEKKAEK